MTSCGAATEVAMAECMEGLGLSLTGTTGGMMGEGGGSMQGKGVGRGGTAKLAASQWDLLWHSNGGSCG